MNEIRNDKNSGSQTDSLKWVICAVAIVVGVYVFYEPLGKYGLGYKIAGLFPFGLLGLIVALRTTVGRSAVALLREALKESKRVVWPTKAEANQTTAVVMCVVALSAFALWLVDLMLNWATSAMIG